MRREGSEFYPSEASIEASKLDQEEELVEVKDNVLEFRKEPPAEHVAKHIFDQMSPEHKAGVILKDMGFNSLEEAEEGISKLESKKQELLDLVNTKDVGTEEKEKIVMTLGAKIKDRVFNKGKIVKELIGLEKEIQQLNRKMRIVRIDMSHKDKSMQEFKKAA